VLRTRFYLTRSQLNWGIRVPRVFMRESRDIRSVVAPPGSELAIAQAFVLADARSPASARSLAALGLELTPALERLEARGLLYRAPAGGWYLDVPRYTARQCRRHAVEVGAIAAAILLLTWLLALAL
jgi:hypothetical protein